MCWLSPLLNGCWERDVQMRRVLLVPSLLDRGDNGRVLVPHQEDCRPAAPAESKEFLLSLAQALYELSKYPRTSTDRKEPCEN